MGSGSVFPPKMMRVIMTTHQTQLWFQHHDGMAMTLARCKTCGGDRLHTIWPDGNYYCIYCLYGQATKGLDAPIPIEPPTAALREFSHSWVAFRRHVKEGEVIPIRSPARTYEKLTPAPAPLCDAAECAVCGTCRPHVADPNGGVVCFHCLMKQGLRTTKIAQPHRPTRDCLDEVARAAAAAVRAAM